jgi:hypothetical protein
MRALYDVVLVVQTEEDQLVGSKLKDNAFEPVGKAEHQRLVNLLFFLTQNFKRLLPVLVDLESVVMLSVMVFD